MSGIDDNLEALIKSVASTLNAQQIPCVLWGHCMLSIHGVSTFIGSLDFIVSDTHLDQAVAILEQSPALVPCPQTICPETSERQSSPPPKHHVHHKGCLEFTIQLFSQTDALPFLEPIDQSLSSKQQLPATYVLASDYISLPPNRPNRGSGHLKEAFTDHADWAMGMAILIREYVGRDGYLNTPIDQKRLSRETGALFIEMFRLKRPAGDWLRDLRRSFDMDEQDVVMDGSATVREKVQAT
ncbi:uncharacterized protein AB675_10477 [Cyphellophora attinorum]|uniref:Uncharacterized protein n=1 Tax=Cyphellophora attinorum TaxID=1664694 RepID=A0A0N0NIM0_9EURO|nr:uncharacterized protein AB675_10477 [Phialophora attinorum]KPI35898.1 hypothetical protein AB675_10477 [Phialophora attinorum]